MKKTLFILIFILSYSYLSQAQQDEGAKDSVNLKAQTFFKEVDKIELIELKLQKNIARAAFYQQLNHNQPLKDTHQLLSN